MGKAVDFFERNGKSVSWGLRNPLFIYRAKIRCLFAYDIIDHIFDVPYKPWSE